MRSHVLGQFAQGTGNELAVRIGGDHRNARHVSVGQLQAEQLGRLLLGRCPGRQTASRRRAVVVAGRCLAWQRVVVGDSAEQLAAGDRVAAFVVDVFAQEHLVRGVRRVRLALVDPRRVAVVGVLGVIGTLVDRRRRVVAMDPIRPRLVLGPRQDHEPELRRQVVGSPGDVVGPGDQRIVDLERHEHRAAALQGLVEAVVEELPEEREQAVVGRRQPDVGGDVGDEQRLMRRHAPDRLRRLDVDGRVGPRDRVARKQSRVVLGPDREAGCCDCRRIGRGLIDDQIADQARLRVDDDAALLRVAGRAGRADGEARRDRLCAAKCRSCQAWERLVGLGELLVAGDQVVAPAIDGPETVRRQSVGNLIRAWPDQHRAVLGVADGVGVGRRVDLVGFLQDRRRVPLGDLDLLEDERQIGWRDREALADGCRRGVGRRGDEHADVTADHRERGDNCARLEASMRGRTAAVMAACGGTRADRSMNPSIHVVPSL